MIRIFFTFIFLFIILSCKKENRKESVLYFPFFQKTALQQLYPEFKERVIKDSLSKIFTDTLFIDKLYSKERYKPLWIKKDMLESRAIDSLLFLIKKSEIHGLNPDYFQYLKMSQLLDSIKAGKYAEEPSKFYSLMVRLECLATQAVIDYSTGLRYGVLNPGKVFKKDYFIPVQQPDSTYYQYLSDNLKKQWLSVISESEPKDSLYSRFQEEMKFYAALAESTFTLISPKSGNANYILNEENPNIPLIAQRLMLTGEIPVTDKADSVYRKLTPELMEAINQFRRKNSYPEDNKIGKLTIDALNRPLSHYKKTIQANLERLRWRKTNPLPEKYIEVNVAGFYLKAIEPDMNPIIMNVCVGRAEKNQTPLLESNISYMNLNPTWNVPNSIIEKEIYRQVRKDPAYLAKNNMKILKRNGQEVDASSINWNELSPKKFPYLIRQDSGDENSLGRIKFMFSNPFSVYLHDTPSQRAFSAKNRAISHGCVRVHKPIDLAFFCLTDKDSLYLDRILYSIDRQPLTREGKRLLNEGKLKKTEDVVYLKKKVPLYINYFTFYILPDKQTYFADDVYYFDTIIRKALMLEP